MHGLTMFHSPQPVYLALRESFTPASLSHYKMFRQQCLRFNHPYMKNQLRTYLLFTPKSYRQGTPVPLVLAFHGYGSQGKDLERATGFSEVAQREGFLIVYPDGLDRRWQAGGIHPRT